MLGSRHEIVVGYGNGNFAIGEFASTKAALDDRSLVDLVSPVP